MKPNQKQFGSLPLQERYLLSLLASITDADAREKILSALYFSKEAHEKQFRDEGAPYVIHPIRAACTLLELGIASGEIIAAMLLHDVVEDTGISIDEIKERFGKRTAQLVQGVTRPRPIHETEAAKKEAKRQKFSEYLRADRETRLIKCADMLDNIRSMSVIPRAHPSRKKFARWYAETEQYSIPIAEKTDQTLARLMREAFASAKKA